MTAAINPRIDVSFKKIFGVDENKDILISLINSVVMEKDQVSKVTLLNPYTPKNFRKDKQSILDIKAEGQTGTRYNIEIQLADEKDYDKRALFYWGKLYTEQLQQGDDYSVLNKSIGIHILNFTSIPGEEKYHNIFQLREIDSHLHYFENMELHTIELNKFWAAAQEKKEVSEFDFLLSKAKKSLDAWVAFLTRHDLLIQDNLPSPLGDPALKKALHVLENMHFTKQEREWYDDHLKWLRMETSALKKKAEDSFQEGIEKGKMDIAKALLEEGVDITTIAKVSGLSLQDLQELQKGNKL